jgi:hypothetical protein
VNRRAAPLRALPIRALGTTLSMPATWPIALAAFLLRGGILLVALPVIVLPTPVGIGNVFAPTLTAIAFGSVSAELIVVMVTAVLAAFVWLVLGGWLAAGLEVEAMRIVAARTAGDRMNASPTGDGTEPSAPAPSVGVAVGSRAAARVLEVRLLAEIPLALVLAWGSVRIVVTAYRELTAPADVVTPILIRVLSDLPEVVVVIVVVWLSGEVVAGMGARRVVLAGERPIVAIRGALGTCLWHPLATLARSGLPTLALLAIVVPTIVATSSAWSAVDAALDGTHGPLAVVALVVGFVALWTGAVLLIAVVSAWRAAVWTISEIARERTFGGSRRRRPGHWRRHRSSATL